MVEMQTTKVIDIKEKGEEGGQTQSSPAEPETTHQDPKSEPCPSKKMVPRAQNHAMPMDPYMYTYLD